MLDGSDVVRPPCEGAASVERGARGDAHLLGGGNMSKTFIVFFVQALIATTAFAQASDPGAFADAAQNALVQQYCEKDGRFMQCLGVDIKKDSARCADLMRGNWRFCRSTFMMTAPASIPPADARTYGDNLAECVRSGAISAAGKSAGAVGLCMSAQ
jgi:hypothetical protein